MSTKMSLAPVFYTSAQVNFNRIEQMDNYIPALQDELRRNGYPDFRRETKLVLDVRRLDKEQPEIKGQQNYRWSFCNSQRTEGYLISSDALIFHTTLYDTFNDFLKKLLNGLDLVHQAIELAYIERIGLRYLNAIVPDNNKELKDYLNPSLLGFSSIIAGIHKHNFTEIMTKIDEGTLVARAIIIDGGLALPPDLSPLQLEIQQKFSSLKGKIATLDIDHFINLNSRSNFDISSVKKQLKKSHDDTLTVAFHAAVTDYARKVWK